MKANELMIGDWVEVIFNDHLKYVQIAEIYQSSILTKESEFESEEVFIDNIRPIPLTPEILEKNGFEIYEQDFTSNIVYKFGSFDYIEYVEYPKYFNIGNKITYKHFTRVITHIHPLMRIRYVHELQHALRLCGIEKEITL